MVFAVKASDLGKKEFVAPHASLTGSSLAYPKILGHNLVKQQQQQYENR